jgi:hypothetical protein
MLIRSAFCAFLSILIHIFVGKKTLGKRGQFKISRITIYLSSSFNPFPHFIYTFSTFISFPLSRQGSKLITSASLTRCSCKHRVAPQPHKSKLKLHFATEKPIMYRTSLPVRGLYINFRLFGFHWLSKMYLRKQNRGSKRQILSVSYRLKFLRCLPYNRSRGQTACEHCVAKSQWHIGNCSALRSQQLLQDVALPASQRNKPLITRRHVCILV